jgi:hypothetical protein
MITLNRDLLDRAARLPRYSFNNEDFVSVDNRVTHESVDGFDFVGAGCERTVWLGADGLVYKVPNRWEWNNNPVEVKRSEELRADERIPDWLYFPEMAYDDVTGIAVAEYIDGTQPWGCYYDTCECVGECRWERAAEGFTYCDSYDGHAGNCVIVEGNSPESFVVAIIDFTR